MEIRYSPLFARRYKKLPMVIKTSAEKREILFRRDWRDPLLAAHKLSGKLDGLWAFSISNRYRVIFEFVRPDMVIFHTIGDHSVYE